MIELKGSPKQVAWAEDIRAKTLEAFANEMKRATERLAYVNSAKGQECILTGKRLSEAEIKQNISNVQARIERLENAKIWLESQEEAKMWIDRRNRTIDNWILWAEYKMEKKVRG